MSTRLLKITLLFSRLFVACIRDGERTGWAHVFSSLCSGGSAAFHCPFGFLDLLVIALRHVGILGMCICFLLTHPTSRARLVAAYYMGVCAGRMSVSFLAFLLSLFCL